MMSHILCFLGQKPSCRQHFALAPRSVHLERLEDRRLLSVGPKNVILMIGDGMGFEHVEAGHYINNGNLSFENLPYQAEMTTHSANNAVTDSGAAATAMATGQKVNNEVISVALPGDGSELTTSLELHQTAGKATGLVTTTYVTHATPAAFGAHEMNRSNYSQIADDYLAGSRPNILFGGSSYMNGAAGAGYTVVTDAASMEGLNTETADMISGQFGDGYMPYEYDDLGELPHLSGMTATALSILDNDPDGFFLMVEGGRIDHASHENDFLRMRGEVIEFSNAVQEVVDWVDDLGNGSDWSNTLVIVTADHETGGLDFDSTTGTVNSWSTTDHTAANVPIYAKGPNAENVGGTMDNTDVFALTTQSATKAPFSVAMIPDTQKYVLEGLPQFEDQTQWIVDHAATENVVSAIHVGDLVENSSGAGSQQTIDEWTRAVTAMDRLDSIPITYAAVAGNHDYDISISGGVDYHPAATDFTANFGSQRYMGKSWYGGGSSDELNHYQIFNAGGRDYLHLGLEFEPRNSALTWAQGIIDANPDLPVILSTHGYMGTTGRLTTSRTTDGYSGEDLFQDFISPNPQIFMVLCGHESGEYYQVSTNDYGQEVIEILADYQDRANGTILNPTNGYMRLLDFYPAFDRIDVRTYSPTLNVYETDANSQFSLTLDYDERFNFDNLPHVVTFENAVDTNLFQDPNRANTSFATATSLNVDADEPSGEGTAAQAILRFDNVFGGNSGQVPLDAQIRSGQLQLQVSNPGNSLDLHRLLQPWSDQDTWNSLSDGIQADDTEAVAIADASTGVVGTGTLSIDVTVSLQAWQATSTNFGWAMLSSGTDGVDFSSAEGSTPPKLIVAYTGGSSNTPPTANADSISVLEGGTVTQLVGEAFSVLDNDTDADLPNDELTVNTTPVSWPSYGTLTLNADGTFSYTHDDSENHTDSFTYELSDAFGATDTAIVSINVTPVNDNGPVFVSPATTTIPENNTMVMTVTAIDADLPAQTIDYSINGGDDQSHFSIDAVTGELTFNVAPTYASPTDANADNIYLVDITADDGNGDTAVQHIAVTVTLGAQTFTEDPDPDQTLTDNGTIESHLQIDDSYVIADLDVEINIHHTRNQDLDVFLISPDEAITVELITDVGANSDNFIGTVFDDEAGVSIIEGTAPFSDSYRPEGSLSDFDGSTTEGTWTLRITDDKKRESGALLSWSLKVTPDVPNQPPTANDDSAATDEDGYVTIDVLDNDSDPERDVLQVVSVTPGANGSTVDHGDGTVTYTPHANFFGDDNFTYTIEDGKGGTDTATVTVTINAIADPPNAVDDVASTTVDTAITIDLLQNDSDPDGDMVSITSVGTATNGVVINNGNGTATYMPDPGFSGSDSFIYTISDGDPETGNADATVAIEVQAVPSELAFTSSGDPIRIGDNKTISSPINIMGTDVTILNLAVRINLTHTSSSDLTAQLISSTGSTLPIDGSIHADNYTYEYVVAGAAYLPLDGTWTLQVTDHVKNRERGFFLEWSMIATPVLAESAMAVPMGDPLVATSQPPTETDTVDDGVYDTAAVDTLFAVHQPEAITTPAIGDPASPVDKVFAELDTNPLENESMIDLVPVR